MRGEGFERQRAIMLSALFVMLAALALVANLPAGLLSSDLARGRPWRTSSTQAVCAPRLHVCAGAPVDIFFHTVEEESPWLEVDLGKPREISSLRIRNRRDCCAERAVPLVVELGDGAASWREVARRDQPFDTWEPKLEKQPPSRFVRLRVARRSIFHLEGVEIFP